MIKRVSLFSWLIVLLSALFFSSFTVAVNEKDWLSNAFDRSHKAASNPYATDVEADDLFETNTSLTIWWPNSGLWTSDSVLVRLTRFMMRLSVILAVPLIMYCAIKIMLALGDEWKLKEAIKHIAYVIAWVLLILFSVMIIFLLTSLTRSSLPYFVN